MTNKVRKAVIPAAGFGTGFLPATKAIAKEMLPIVDKPIIQFIVEEAIESGIEEILIITGKTKRPIEDHFDSNIELEDNLSSKGKTALLDLVKSTTTANLFFVRQSYPVGLGDAIYHAKAFVGDEPFAVLLGDNIIESDIPVTKELIELYERTKAANVAVMPIDPQETEHYGIIDVERQVSDGVYNVAHFVEKPLPEEAPSQLGLVGRYILTPEIFDFLESQEAGVENEVQLTDAIEKLNEIQRVFAYEVKARHYDVGNRQGYVEMSIEYGLKHPEIASDLKDYLKKLGQTLVETQEEIDEVEE